MEKKVSIIIPIFNDEKHIKTSITSILNQTYHDIEIICVDDCSTDGSMQIVKYFADMDSRIKYVAMKKNEGAYMARKYGVEFAVGDYVLFWDADDYADVGLIEELIELEKQSDCDIIHFSAAIVNCGVTKQRIVDMQEFVKPLSQTLYNSSVFFKCFCTEEYGFNIWNKIFRAELCKAALEKLPNIYIPKANDVFIFYFLAVYAKSYMGCETKNKYYYCFGNGNTGEKNLSDGEFDRYCHYNQMLEVMQEYVESGEKITLAEVFREEALHKLKERFLRESVETWIFSVKEDSKTAALGNLIASWNMNDIMDVIFRVFPMYKNMFAKYIFEGVLLPRNLHPSKNIAFYYSKFGKGGVERVISLLIPLFMQVGYGVTLITEVEKQEDDFVLPDQVKRYTIPAKADIVSGKIGYIERAGRLAEICEKERIDTMCYQEASSRFLFFDLAIFKSMGIKFILSKHELYSQHMVFNHDLLTDEMTVYPLVDVLTVLSHEEEVFWNALGVRSVLIPNPMTLREYSDFQYNKDTHNIVWVGRLDRNQKRYQDIVPIMQEVVKEIPDAVLRIYGSSETYKDEYLLKAQIDSAQLKEHIKYMGYSTQIEEIYANAGVMLMTSAYESSPMVIIESKQLGIPLVTYSMPYIETLKNGKGFVEIEQGNTIAAAKAIVRILQDADYRMQLSNGAKCSLDNYSNSDVITLWKRVFTGNISCDMPEENIYGRIIHTMVFHQSLGSRKYADLRRRYKELLKISKLQQTERIVNERGLKLALYPYGTLGVKLREYLESAGMEVSLVVDNSLKGKIQGIVSIDDLKEKDISQYLFIICSNNMKYYEEIRTAIYAVAPEENIYDWYPVSEE